MNVVVILVIFSVTPKHMYLHIYSWQYCKATNNNSNNNTWQYFKELKFKNLETIIKN